MHFPRPIILLAVIAFIISMPALSVSKAEAQVRTPRITIVTGPLGRSMTLYPGEKLIIKYPTLSVTLSGNLSSRNFVTSPVVKSDGSTSIEPINAPVVVNPVGVNEISIEPITAVSPPDSSEYPMRALYLCITEGRYDHETKSCDEIITFYLFSIVEPLSELRLTLKDIPFPLALKPPPGTEDIGLELNRLIDEAIGLLKTSKFKEAKEKLSILLAKFDLLIALADLNVFQRLQRNAACVEKWISYCDAKTLQANSDNQTALNMFGVLAEADSQDCDELSVNALFEMGYTNKKMGRPETALELCSRALSLCNNPDLKAFIHMQIALMLHSLYSRENTFHTPSRDHFMAALEIVRDTGTKILIHVNYASALQRFDKNAALRELDEAESICKEKPSECGNDTLDQIAAARQLYMTPPVQLQTSQPTENVRQKPFMRWFHVIGLIVAIILIFDAVHSLKKNIKQRLANRPAARLKVARYAFMSRFRNYLEIKLAKLINYEIQIERLIDDVAQSNSLYFRFNEENFDPYLQRVEVSLSDSGKTSIANISVYYNGQQLSHDVVDLEDYRLT